MNRIGIILIIFIYSNAWSVENNHSAQGASDSLTSQEEAYSENQNITSEPLPATDEYIALFKDPKNEHHYIPNELNPTILAFALGGGDLTTLMQVNKLCNEFTHHPQLDSTYFSLGLQALKNKQFAKAGQYFSRISSHYSLTPAQMSKIVLHTMQGYAPQIKAQVYTPHLVSLFQAAAETGAAETQFNLGRIYLHGLGVKKDINEAIKYFEFASRQGHEYSQLDLSWIYSNLEGFKDDKKTLFYNELAAAQGCALANRNLGAIYRHARGVKVDKSKALEYYERAATLGDTLSCVIAGSMYHAAEGASRDPIKAREYFERAAAKGDTDAEAFLAGYYFEGKGGEKDINKALELMKRAADKGHSMAISNLARMRQHLRQ